MYSLDVLCGRTRRPLAPVHLFIMVMWAGGSGSIVRCSSKGMVVFEASMVDGRDAVGISDRGLSDRA